MKFAQLDKEQIEKGDTFTLTDTSGNEYESYICECCGCKLIGFYYIGFDTNKKRLLVCGKCKNEICWLYLENAAGVVLVNRPIR